MSDPQTDQSKHNSSVKGNITKEDEKQIAAEVEKTVETEVPKWVNSNQKKIGYYIGEIIAILITIFMIWAAHNVTHWTQPIFSFVKPEFTSIVWVIDLALGTSIITRLIRLCFPNVRLKLFLQIIDNCFSLLLMWQLITVFPYDFSKLIPLTWINGFMQVVFGISIFGLFVAIIVESVKLVSNVLNLDLNIKK